MEKLTPEQVATAKLGEIKKSKESKVNLDDKKEAEPKGAAPESSPEKAKTEEPLAKEPAKPATEQDKDALSKALNEDKVNKRKVEIQGEIDKLISEKKEYENIKVQSEKMKQEMSDMQKQIDAHKAEKAKLDADAAIPEEQKVLRKIQDERLTKYLEEDKVKPREQRREMSKDELDEWSLEDLTGAQEWIADRALRRKDETQADRKELANDKWVSNLLAKHAESGERVNKNHPELQQAHTEEVELMKQGKTQKEIVTILSAKYPKFKVMAEIMSEKSKEFILNENMPELLAEEMEKRLTKEPAKKEEPSELDKLKAELAAKEAEIERLKGVDETLGSTQNGEKPKNEKKTEAQLAQEAIAKRAGISLEALNKRKEARKKIPGASDYDESKG